MGLRPSVSIAYGIAIDMDHFEELRLVHEQQHAPNKDYSELDMYCISQGLYNTNLELELCLLSYWEFSDQECWALVASGSEVNHRGVGIYTIDTLGCVKPDSQTFIDTLKRLGLKGMSDTPKVLIGACYG